MPSARLLLPLLLVPARCAYFWCRLSRSVAALKTGDNQFTILAERYRLSKRGTGGLMGPVVLYREK